MALSSTAAKVAAIVKKPIEDLGLILWDVRYVKEGTSWYLRIFVDKEGGVNINDCTDVSHLVDPLIDEADPIDASYFLEVCSPGLERELLRSEHFERFKGSSVKVKLIRPREGTKELAGILLSENNGDVTVKTEAGEVITFQKNEISGVRLNDCAE